MTGKQEKQNLGGIHDVIWLAIIAGLVTIANTWMQVRTQESVDKGTAAIKEEAEKTTEEVKKIPEATAKAVDKAENK